VNADAAIVSIMEPGAVVRPGRTVRGGTVAEDGTNVGAPTETRSGAARAFMATARVGAAFAAWIASGADSGTPIAADVVIVGLAERPGAVAGMDKGATALVGMKAIGIAFIPPPKEGEGAEGVANAAGSAAPTPGASEAFEVGIVDEAGSLRGRSTGIN